MIKVTEDYVSYKVAKLLNEKGFEIDTNNDYWKIGEDGIMYFMSSIGAYSSNPNDEYAIYRPENSYPCLTHQMAMKWLREVHNIYIDISPTYSEVEKTIHFIWQIFNSNYDNIGDCEIFYDKYETACKEALKYSLENLI